MCERLSVRFASVLALALALAAFAAAGARAASDCFEPLRQNAAWSCRAELSDGQVVDHCLERTHVFGVDPDTRSFKTVASGPYPASCSCQAKGKFPGAAFGAAKTYLCVDRATDTVIRGRGSKRSLSGETFNVSANSRATFRCEPDPACDVQRVVDPDLRPESGFLPLLAEGDARLDVFTRGDISLGYLSGCGGYASEAPTLNLRVGAGVPGSDLTFRIGRALGETDAAGILVVTPFGEAHCATGEVTLPAEPGAYGVWVRSNTPGAEVDAILYGFHRAP